MKCLIFISCELSDLACLVTNISIGRSIWPVWLRILVSDGRFGLSGYEY